MGVVVIGGGGSGGGGGGHKSATGTNGTAQVIAVDGEIVGTFTSLEDAERYAAMLNAEADQEKD